MIFDVSEMSDSVRKLFSEHLLIWHKRSGAPRLLELELDSFRSKAN